MRIDVHQHLWSEPLVHALATRSELPLIRSENGLSVLHLAGERPYVIDLAAEEPARRAALVERDGLDRALLCLSSPLGIEWLRREESVRLIDAYHDGAFAIGGPFGVWGAIALQRIEVADVDRALARGCIGVSLPAGALASVAAVRRLEPLLARLEELDAPLLVHPGPGAAAGGGPAIADQSLRDPLWWAALSGYVASIQAAWLAFVVAGRPSHPRLRVVFAMLAGLAPLHAERLRARGGPGAVLEDRLSFYETSSYGPAAVSALAEVVGVEQLLYGSDRPVVEPDREEIDEWLDWDAVADSTLRALGVGAGAPR